MNVELIRSLCRATMAEIIELQRGHHLIIYASIHNVSFLTTTNTHLTATDLLLQSSFCSGILVIEWRGTLTNEEFI